MLMLLLIIITTIFIVLLAISLIVYFTFLSMNNSGRNGFATFERFKKEYDKVEWKDIDKHFDTWIFGIPARWNYENNCGLRYSIIEFNGNKMKLNPIDLIRAILYVRKDDKLKGIYTNPWKENN